MGPPVACYVLQCYSTNVRFCHVTKLKLPIYGRDFFKKMLQSTRKKRDKGCLYPVVTVTLVTQGGPPCYHYKALQSGGCVTKKAQQNLSGKLHFQTSISIMRW